MSNLGFTFNRGSAEEAPQENESGSAAFPVIDKLSEDTDDPVFSDSSYYKTVLGDSGDSAKRLHTVFQKYATAKDVADKSLFRQQVTSAFWDFLSSICKDSSLQNCLPKKFFMRYGMLHPGALSPESRSFFARLIQNNDLGEPIYYLDEWFKKVGRGDVKASAIDETSVASSKGGKESAHIRALFEKAQGKLDGIKGILRTKNAEKINLERELSTKTTHLVEHQPSAAFDEINECYSESQKGYLNDILEGLKNASRIDRDMSRLLEEYQSSKDDVHILQGKLSSSSEADAGPVDMQALDTEYNSLRQMAKMTIGRQGNAFPVLTNEYFHSVAENVGFRENVIKKLAWIEAADSEVFIRVYKNNPSRIVPYVVLIPTYGDFGVCWEPFDKHNKATSRGRIAIPMYPKNITVAMLTAIGDFRWQVAKESTSMYWMEEGLTGNYFQWFQAQKLKGDVKVYFIQDYITWMTKEREGVQKLDKNVRGIFWRYMPFAQDLKDKLKDRNLVYQELYQRDQNRAKSDGY